MRGSGALDIAQDLQRQIRSGTLVPGQALAPRLDLARHYGVARATIDRAIDLLSQSDVVRSRQGAGTWVREVLPGPRVAMLGSALPTQDLAGCGLRLHGFSYEQVHDAATRQTLRNFDGLLWYRPEAQALAWAAELAGKIPQVLINRAEADFVCVSTDHRTPYQHITRERLAAAVDAEVYFLRRDQPTLVSGYREAGFLKACREQKRRYRTLIMPADFSEALALLHKSLPSHGHPALVVADNLAHTGAVMTWAQQQQRRWRQDLWYSDFDNTYPAHVWGVVVTSFIQREAEVHAAAAQRLLALIHGDTHSDIHTLVQPSRRDGAT